MLCASQLRTLYSYSPFKITNIQIGTQLLLAVRESKFIAKLIPFMQNSLSEGL